MTLRRKPKQEPPCGFLNTRSPRSARPACPHALQYLEEHPQASAAEVRRALLSTATPNTVTGQGVPEPAALVYTGFGSAAGSQPAASPASTVPPSASSSGGSGEGSSGGSGEGSSSGGLSTGSVAAVAAAVTVGEWPQPGGGNRGTETAAALSVQNTASAALPDCAPAPFAHRPARSDGCRGGGGRLFGLGPQKEAGSTDRRRHRQQRGQLQSPADCGYRHRLIQLCHGSRAGVGAHSPGRSARGRARAGQQQRAGYA